MRALSLLALLALASCDDAPIGVAEGPDWGPPPDTYAPPPALRRLTDAQYRNVIEDLFGPGLVMPAQLEPDKPHDGLLSLGAALNNVSFIGVTRYEEASYLIAEQVMQTPRRRDRVLTCAPASPSDRTCAREVVETVGSRVFRRPLHDREVERYTDVIVGIGADSGDFETGVTYGLAGLLQSPHFIYRMEQGVPIEGKRRLTSYELAGRLSFLVWNTMPDDALFEAAASGVLLTDKGLEAEFERMWADPRAQDGVRNLFDELWGLYNLEDLTKDPIIFSHASDELGAAAREETMLGIEANVFGEEDYRDLFTTQRTFVDRRLAAIYNIKAPTDEGFGEVRLTRADNRRGVLGHVSILALNSHAASTSPTKRGKFVRNSLLCFNIPPPPADVVTEVPEPDTESPTLRERMESTHLSVERCAACHQYLDPIGFGLENYDGIGRWRDTENGATIDASGEIDGQTFDTPWQLSEVVSEDEDLAWCLSKRTFAYAMGHPQNVDEAWLARWLSERMEAHDYRVRDMLQELVMTPAFREAGELSRRPRTVETP